MSIRFNADEILRIAEQIEVNGSHFYYAAAALAPASAALFDELSAWEMRHAERFAAMRHALSAAEREPTAHDPDDEIALYLQAVADGTVFQLVDDPQQALGPAPTPEDVLHYALGKEHESIAYYTAMRDYVPIKAGAAQVDAIIREELSHVALLHRQLAALRDA